MVLRVKRLTLRVKQAFMTPMAYHRYHGTNDHGITLVLVYMYTIGPLVY